MGKQIRHLNDNIYDFDTLKMPFDKEGIPEAVKEDPYKFYESFWRQYNLATANYVTLQPKKTRSYNFTDNTNPIYGVDKTDWKPGQIVVFGFKSGTIVHHNYPVTGNNIPIILRAKSEYTLGDDEDYFFRFLDTTGDGTPDILREIGSSTKFEQSFKNEYVAVLKDSFVDEVVAGELFDEPGWATNYLDGCVISWQGDAEIGINDDKDNINIYVGGSIYNFIIFEPDGETIRHWFPFCEAPRVISSNNSLAGYKKRWDVITGEFSNINYTDNDNVDDFFYCHRYGFNNIVSPDTLNTANQPFKTDKTSLYPASFLLGSRYDGGTYYNVAKLGDYYITKCDGDGLRAYSFDGSSFTLEGSIDDGYQYREGIFVQGGYIFVGIANSGIAVYSFDGSTFTLEDQVSGGFYNRHIWGDGTYIYIGTQNNGVTVYEFTGGNINKITDALTDASVSGDNGVWGDGTYLYTSVIGGAIRVYSFNGSNLTLEDEFNNVAVGGTGYHIWGDGTYVYMACGTDGIRAYEFTGGSIVARGQSDAGNAYRYVEVDDVSGIIYVSNTANMLQYKFNGTSFELIGQIANSSLGFMLTGEYVVSAASTNGIFAFSTDIIFGWDETATEIPQRGTNRGCILKGDPNKAEMNPAKDPAISNVLSNTKMNFSEIETEAGINADFSIHYKDANNDNIDYAEVTTERGLIIIEAD